MSKWEDFIQEGSYKGVKFDFVNAREEHANVLDIQRYPRRDGQVVQKMAREGLRISVMAVFIEDDYPQKMWDLSEKLDDGTPGELVHPIHGTIQASCERHTVIHDAEDADSAVIEITFVEHTKETGLVFSNRPSVAAKASEARDNATSVNTLSVDYYTAVLDTLLETVSLAVAVVSTLYTTAVTTAENCQDAATFAAGVADTLEADGDSMSALEIEALSNQALSKLDAQVKVLADYTTTEAYELGKSLLATAASLGDLARLHIEAKPPLVLYTIAVPVPLLVWVHERYGDSSRVDEVLALNSIPDPLELATGTQLRAYGV